MYLPEQQESESPKAWQAFKEYLLLGPSRTLRILHEKFLEQNQQDKVVPTTSLKTIRTWAWQHDWTERAKRYDETQEKVTLEALSEVERKDFLQEVQAYRQRLKEGAAIAGDIALVLEKKALQRIQAVDFELSDREWIRALMTVARLLEVVSQIEGASLGVTQLVEQLEQEDGEH